MKIVYSVLSDPKALAELIKQGYTVEQLTAALTKIPAVTDAVFKFVPTPGRKYKKK